MNGLSTGTRMVIRVTGLLQIILGIPIWTGKADGLTPIHLLLGIVLVLSLWILAFISMRAGVAVGTVGLAFGWGALAVVLGLSQKHILTGQAHWIVQILHLLVGLGAIALGERLGMLLRAQTSPSLAQKSRR